MYNIMIMKKDLGAESLWQFITSTTEGSTEPRIFESAASVDTFVEELINNGSYKKTEIMVVSVTNFTVDATLA